ncbi:hypothetical protein [Niabella aurantiaca]|uniref:hypothetical protein n=1 Tax=Niabella aurantiaca TaxID=379900 RepID=UPI00037B76A9|nr:hypothetical protein [Niabella aurantiaca]
MKKRVSLWSLVVLYAACIPGGCHPPSALTLPPSPCPSTRSGSANATLLFDHDTCKAALVQIIHAAGDGKEHAVSFGKDRHGNIIRSAVSNGAANTAPLPFVAHRFADLHNHPENKPPSSGDLYHLIDQATAYDSSYQKFILLPDGTAYALRITDPEAAKNFNTRYPRVAGITNTAKGVTYQPTFPRALVNELNRIKGWGEATEEAAIVFMLQKYRTGIALLKRDQDGQFRMLHTTLHTRKDGVQAYTVAPCP